MKNALIIISATLLVACNSVKEKNNDVKDPSIDMVSENSNAKPDNGQERINTTVPYEETVMLLGKANRKGLEMESFQDWFNPGYKNYTVNPETLEKLKPLLKNVSITAFMGTWCEDSQRDVPHLYKILDKAEFDESKLTLITVSEEKTTPQGFEKGKNITNVPTIIFYRADKELGRIVEYPIETLEKDMLAILSGKEYKHAYAE